MHIFRHSGIEFRCLHQHWALDNVSQTFQGPELTEKWQTPLSNGFTKYEKGNEEEDLHRDNI